MTFTILAWAWMGLASASGYTLDPTSGLPVVSSDPQAQLPFDPHVEHGVLHNGFTWFVEHNERPSGRAEIRFFAKVGSVLEDDGERGVAHYLEHLAFNGTKHFPEQSLVRWLESLGMRFGADINATTGLDHTVYMLQVPTDDPEVLRRALLVVHDWIDGIVFDDAECAREQGVVLEEWRRSQGLSERIIKATYPYEFYNSRYVGRRPSGDEASIRRLDCDIARAFHERWYQPDQLAIAVVGDVDVHAVSKEITKTFRGLKRDRHAPERPIYTVPVNHPLLVSIHEDPELTDLIVRVSHKLPSVEENTHAAYRRFLLSQIAFVVFGERLSLASISPEAPWLAAGAIEEPKGLLRVAHVVQASAKKGEANAALRRLLHEVRAMKEAGVTQSELQRAVRQMQTGMNAYYDERKTTDSATHIDELGRVFLEDEPIPGIPYEYALSKKILPSITVDALNSYLGSDAFFPDFGRVIELLAPAGSSLPSEAQVRAMVAQVDKSQPPPPQDEGVAASIVSTPPPPGAIVSESFDSDLGITTFNLSNGVRVLAMPTSIQADQVVVHGFAPGGAHAEPEERILDTLIASKIAQRSGVGEHDVTALAKRLAGRPVGVSLEAGSWYDTVRGGATVAELPTLFKLLWAMASQPRIDPAQFAMDLKERRASVIQSRASPVARFDEHWSILLWQNHPLAVPWRLEDLDRITIDGVRAAWNDRVTDLDDLTLVVVGNVSAEALRPLLKTWVSTLPASPRVDQVIDRGERRVAGGKVDERIQVEGLPGAIVRVQWHMPWENSPKDRMLIRGVSDLLSGRLHDELREHLGGTYQVQTEGYISQFPTAEAVVTAEFQCDPARLDELLAAMEVAVRELRMEQWPDVTFEVFREQNARTHQSNMQDNAWWAARLVNALKLGEPLTSVLDFADHNAVLTPQSIQQAAAKILTKAHRVRLIGVPTP